MKLINKKLINEFKVTAGDSVWFVNNWFVTKTHIWQTGIINNLFLLKFENSCNFHRVLGNEETNLEDIKSLYDLNCDEIILNAFDILTLNGSSGRSYEMLLEEKTHIKYVKILTCGLSLIYVPDDCNDILANLDKNHIASENLKNKGEIHKIWIE